MSHTSHGTITISDLTDITDVYLQYGLALANATVTNSYSFNGTGEVGWSTTYPTWQSGYQIWIRQVTEKEGLPNEYGTPYLDTAVNQLNTTISAANANIVALQTKTKKIWTNLNNSTTYPAGTYAASGINNGEVTENNSSTYGYNTFLTHNKLALRYNAIDMAALTTNVLTFYTPTQDSNNNWIQGEKGVELSTDGLILYNPVASTPNNKGLELNNNGLYLYKPLVDGEASQSTAAQLTATGLNITNGSIELANGTNDSIKISNSNFTRSINSISHDDLRMAIGDKFGVASNGTLYASNANIKGIINATSGFIGQDITNGFTISNSAIYNPSTKTTLSSDTRDGIYLGKDGIALGQGTFKVTSAGALTAKSGTIGGITIGETYLTTNSSRTTYDATTTGLTITASGIGAGNGTTNTFKVDASTGALTAGNATLTGGKIAGWSFNTTSLYKDNATPGASTSAMVISTGTSSSNTIGGSTGSNTWMLSAGTGFGVTTAGKLYANDAKIKGIIEATSGSISDSVTIGGKAQSEYLNSEIEVGGRNILKNSGSDIIKLWGTAASNGGTMTKTTGQTVSEWGASNAIRVTGQAGSTNTLFGLINTIYANTDLSISGKPYVFSIYIKNNASTNLTIGFNGLGSSVVVQPNTITRVVSTNAKGTGSSNVQFTISAAAKSGSYDFIYWHPQIEYGTKVTDWSPAPEDVDADITDATKVATNYIAYISADDGIKVHNYGDTTDYVQVNSTKIAMYRNSVEKMQLTDSLLRLGDISNYAKINADGMEVYKGGTSVAQFGSNVVLGTTNKLVLSSNQILLTTGSIVPFSIQNNASGTTKTRTQNATVAASSSATLNLPRTLSSIKVVAGTSANPSGTMTTLSIPAKPASGSSASSTPVTSNNVTFTLNRYNYNDFDTYILFVNNAATSLRYFKIEYNYTDDSVDVLVNDAQLKVNEHSHSYITAGSSGKLLELQVITYGHVVSIFIRIQTTASTAAGGNLFVGTLYGLRPYGGCQLHGYYGANPIMGSIGDTGAVVIRNCGTGSLSVTGNNSIGVGGTFITEDSTYE